VSAKDLISKWEDALAQVLQEALDESPDLSDEDLEQVSPAVAGVALRSQLRAGEWWPTPTRMC
jgi:hypothetical protein